VKVGAHDAVRQAQAYVQGGPLSRLLSNILLTDANIYVGSKRAGEGVMARTIQTLNPLLRGWANYFRLSVQHKRMKDLDGWLRRRLRCLLWRQWKRLRTRKRYLLAQGLSPERAWKSSVNGRGPRWNAGASHMKQAFPNAYFERLGLVSIYGTVARLQRTH